MPEPTLSFGAHGSAVVVLQKALNAHGCRLAEDGVFGAATLNAVRRFQASHHLTVDGVVGPQTWTALGLKPAPAGAVSVKLAALAAYHGGPIIYSEDPGLRMQGVLDHVKLPHIPRSADCSGLCVWTRYAAGLSDPTGNGFNGTGNSVAMQARGVRVPVADAVAGDYAFYSDGSRGRGVSTHVAIYIGGLEVISHGSPGGPRLEGVYYRPDLMEVRRYA